MTALKDRIGITATVPSEVIYAADLRPVDLNNIFINGPDALADIQAAEERGFPANTCNWIKGCYAAARREGIRTVVAVSQGDCANTHALAEIFASEGVRIIHYAYPHPRDRAALRESLADFAGRFGVTLEAAEDQKRRLDAARAVVHAIDDLTWRTGQVTGAENHRWTVATSDLEGDPEAFADRARAFLIEAGRRPKRAGGIRIGLIGIPPIARDLHEAFEMGGARIVFNEFPWQFSMPYPSRDLVEQYHAYSYPYDVFYRLDRIAEEVGRRGIAALVHYVQSFCFRHIQDRLIRERLDVPILTLEVDRPGPLDGRSRTRADAFLEILEARARGQGAGAAVHVDAGR